MEPTKTLNLLALDGGEKGKEEGSVEGSSQAQEEPKTIEVTIGTSTYEIPDTPEGHRLARDYEAGYKDFLSSKQEAADLRRLSEVEEEGAEGFEEESPPSSSGDQLDEVDRELLKRAEKLGFVTKAAAEKIKTEAKREAQEAYELGRVQNTLEEVLSSCEKDSENYPAFDRKEVTRHMWQDLGILHPGKSEEEVRKRVTLAYSDLGLSSKEGKTKKPVYQERPTMKQEKGTPPPKPLPKDDEELQKSLAESTKELFQGGGET